MDTTTFEIEADMMDRYGDEYVKIAKFAITTERPVSQGTALKIIDALYSEQYLYTDKESIRIVPVSTG